MCEVKKAEQGEEREKNPDNLFRAVRDGGEADGGGGDLRGFGANSRTL